MRSASLRVSRLSALPVSICCGGNHTAGQRPASTQPYGGVGAAERVGARRDRLLAAGLEMFGNAGYLETTVKGICAEAGLTGRYFYESFDDKQAPFIAVFDAVTGELFGLVAEAVAAGAVAGIVAQCAALFAAAHAGITLAAQSPPRGAS